jgi:thioredoxin reductase
MKHNEPFDAVIVGGSFAGLSAAMALGRSLKKVLVIDNHQPCNQQTPHAHNLLTQDGKAPGQITAEGKAQVQQYDTVEFLDGLVIDGKKEPDSFVVTLESGEEIQSKTLLFATGLRDRMLEVPGFSECWGISILHCPFCHGYEVKGENLGVLGNGTTGFQLVQLIYNWSDNLTLYTNGTSTLSREEEKKLQQKGIAVVEKKFRRLEHRDGRLQRIVFEDNSSEAKTAIFARVETEQKCKVPLAMGCELTEHGSLHTDDFQRTTVEGIYAAGDSASPLRTLSIAIASGTKAGAVIVHDLVLGAL